MLDALHDAFLELFNYLRHPSLVAVEAAGLSRLARLCLSGGIMAGAIVTAYLVGVFGARWARRHTGDVPTEMSDRLIDRLRSLFARVVLFAGAYYAVLTAPLPARVAELLAGGIYVLAAIAATIVAPRAVALFVSLSMERLNPQERTRIERDYLPMAEKLSGLAVASIAAIVVARHFDKDVSSIVAALGLGSLAVGLAAQQTLGNMIAGFVLLVDRPFRVGDRVRLASGEVGEVQFIGVRSTRIRLLDNNTLVVPNAELANTRVVNFATSSRSDVRILVAVGADADQAIAALAAAAAEDSRLRGVSVRVSNLTVQGIELSVLFETESPRVALEAEEQLRRRALVRLRAAGIVLPDLLQTLHKPSSTAQT